MFRALLWKELREQAAILIALLVLGSGIIAAATTLGSTSGSDASVRDIRAYTNAGRLAVLALAVAAGVVIGGSLFAGEKENDTFANLELLPARRISIWWGKLLAGLVMMSGSAFILLSMASLLGALGTLSPLVWIFWGFVLVFIAFGWGTFGSTICDSTLTACAVGLLCAVVLGVPIFAISLGIFRELIPLTSESKPLLYELAPLLAMYCVGIVPLIIGAAIFTAPDRARQPIVEDEPSSPRAVVRRVARPGGFYSSLRALVWLTKTQWFVAGGIGIALAIIAGVCCLHEEVQMIVLWPALSLFAGVMGGVLAWADEQHKETNKYWGERRLPLNRLWIMKLAASFVVVMGWSILMLCPLLIRQLAFVERSPFPDVPSMLGSGLLSYEGERILHFLLIGPMYGFAFGHLSGILFKKSVVAIGVGTLTASPVAALWFPSLIAGGVHWWQIWVIPLVVLFASRLVLRAWTADRLGTIRPLAALGILGAACLAFTAFGLVYRFAEVPVVPEIEDDLKYADTVPLLDFEDGGRAFRGTMSTYQAALNDLLDERHRGAANARDYLVMQLGSRSWPEAEFAAIRGWLDRKSVDELLKNLTEAARLPAGPIENPRGMHNGTILKESNELRPVADLLMARGLSKPTDFADCLEAALALSRNGRTQQPGVIFLLGANAEWTTLEGTSVYLERHGRSPEHLRSILRLLAEHERTCPDDKQVFMTERMISRNTLDQVSQWGPKALAEQMAHINGGNYLGKTERKGQVEAELLSFALAVPWERERSRRRFGIENSPLVSARVISSEFGMNHWLEQYLSYGQRQVSGSVVLYSQANSRVTMAQVALALYQLETGKPAAKLDDLVPKYLAAVPLDPYDSRPLRYRISTGESIKYTTKSNPIVPQLGPNDPGLGQEEREAFGGFVGGWAFSDRRFGIAPGFALDGSPEVDLDAVAAVAGTLVQWPLEELDETGLPAFAGGTGEAGGGALGGFGQQNRMAEGWRVQPETIVRRDVENGQGIVWSIGNDRFDDGGKKRSEYPGDSGDILRIVPKLTANK